MMLGGGKKEEEKERARIWRGIWTWKKENKKEY